MAPIAIITNPPYAQWAPQFVSKALEYTRARQGFVAMLLRNEFDSASTRIDLFTHSPFYGKLVLTKRPRWKEYEYGDPSPKHNYSWFVWDWVRAKQDVCPNIWYHKFDKARYPDVR